MDERKIGTSPPRRAPRLIGWVLVAVLIPFVLISDLFPLLRMGMFAEPVRSDQQIELYRLRHQRGGDAAEWLDIEGIAKLPEHHFDYLARTRVAENKTQELLLGSSEALRLDRLGQLELWRIRIPRGAESAADTSLVDELDLSSL